MWISELFPASAFRPEFQSRRRHVYGGVPSETYAAMKVAFSKGEFFNRHIRDNFAFRREDTAA